MTEQAQPILAAGEYTEPEIRQAHSLRQYSGAWLFLLLLASLIVLGLASEPGLDALRVTVVGLLALGFAVCSFFPVRLWIRARRIRKYAAAYPRRWEFEFSPDHTRVAVIDRTGAHNQDVFILHFGGTLRDEGAHFRMQLRDGREFTLPKRFFSTPDDIACALAMQASRREDMRRHLEIFDRFQSHSLRRGFPPDTLVLHHPLKPWKTTPLPMFFWPRWLRFSILMLLAAILGLSPLAGLALIGYTFQFGTSELCRDWLLGLLGLGLLFYLPGWGFWFHRRHIRPSEFTDRAQGFILDHDGVTYMTARVIRQISWSFIHSFRVRFSGIELSFADGSPPLVIPRAALTDFAMRQRIVEMLQRHVHAHAPTS